MAIEEQTPVKMNNLFWVELDQAVKAADTDRIAGLKDLYLRGRNPHYKLLQRYVIGHEKTGKVIPDQAIIDCLAEGFDVFEKYQGNSPLQHILSSYSPKNKPLVELLLQLHNKKGLDECGQLRVTPLCQAVERDDPALVQQLIDAGATVDAVVIPPEKVAYIDVGRLLDNRLHSRNYIEMKEIAKSPYSHSALCAAVLADKPHMVNLLVRASADVNQRLGYYASVGLLALAAVNGRYLALEELLQHGARFASEEAMLYAYLDQRYDIVGQLLKKNLINEGINHPYSYHTSRLTEEVIRSPDKIGDINIYRTKTLLTIAIERFTDGDLTRINKLAELGAEFFPELSEKTYTPLEAVLDKNDEALFNALLERKGTMELSAKHIPFRHAADDGKWGVLEHLEKFAPMDQETLCYVVDIAMRTGALTVVNKYLARVDAKEASRNIYGLLAIRNYVTSMVNFFYYMFWRFLFSNPKGSWTQAYQVVIHGKSYKLEHSPQSVKLAGVENEEIELGDVRLKVDSTPVEFESEMLRSGIPFIRCAG